MLDLPTIGTANGVQLQANAQMVRVHNPQTDQESMMPLSDAVRHLMAARDPNRRQIERNERTNATNILTLWGDPDGDKDVESLSQQQLRDIALEAFNLATSIRSRNAAK